MAEIFDKKLGENLMSIRVAHGMSQQYVADRMGLSRAAISFYELGKRTIDVETLFKLCDIYNVDVNDVVNSVRKYVYKK